MREIRTSGSEGGGAESNQLSLPLYSRREKTTTARKTFEEEYWDLLRLSGVEFDEKLLIVAIPRTTPWCVSMS